MILIIQPTNDLFHVSSIVNNYFIAFCPVREYFNMAHDILYMCFPLYTVRDLHCAIPVLLHVLIRRTAFGNITPVATDTKFLFHASIFNNIKLDKQNTHI